MTQCSNEQCTAERYTGFAYCRKHLDELHNRMDAQAPTVVGDPDPSYWITSPTVNEGASGPFHEMPKEASSGGDNDYWVAFIKSPKRLEPYNAECEDIIEHFEMTFQEGEAFKALWRKGQARIGNGKPGDSPLRNAQKVFHFGGRMVAMEKRKR